jgi:tellurite methyltransferase
MMNLTGGFNMNIALSQNIAKYRKLKKFTQEELAQKLGISFQAVSKWETGQSLPDVSLLPELAYYLDTDINALLGYAHDIRKISIYEEEYRQDAYYWGVVPSKTCYRILELMPPVRPIRLLDVCCGEGRDAVFFAKNGYSVTAFDISESGIEKTKRLADRHSVTVNAFTADLNDFRLDTEFDIIYSTGAFHYIRPEFRDEIVENFKSHTSTSGLNVFNVFVNKPFIAPPPENEPVSIFWKSGVLFTYYTDWLLHEAAEMIFDCDSSGIPHQHCINHMIAERLSNLYSRCIMPVS